MNPPGEEYEACAHFIGDDLKRRGFEVEYIAAEGLREHTVRHPRVNVVGTRRGGPGPVVHLNGHFDVVPAGDGWTVDPFGGLVRDGRIYGRGSCDMKAGIAAALFAAEAIERAGVPLPGTIEISGTVDEESGGFAGVAYLAECGRIAKGKTDFVIIPEPLNVDRICVGHRGVYWFEVTARGRIGHGSMPFLGVNAIDGHGATAPVDPRRADAGAGVAGHRDSGRAAGRAPRDDQHQRDRGRPGGRRDPDAVRRRSVSRGVRSTVSDRGRLRRHEGGDRSARRSRRRRARRASASSCAT